VLAGSGELFGESVRFGAEVTVAVRPGKRGEVEQHPAAALIQVEHRSKTIE
jgi:hypothetical protein